LLELATLDEFSELDGTDGLFVFESPPQPDIKAVAISNAHAGADRIIFVLNIEIPLKNWS
jgi:hypothetical protein